jgi:DNA modification methylase
MGPFWEQIERVCKPKAALVFTAQQPFTSFLVAGNPKWFRFSMVWEKNNVRGFLNAKRQPLRAHEDILVFYRSQPTYQPQFTEGHEPVHAYTKTKANSTNYGQTRTSAGGGSTQRYPTTVLRIPVVHSTDLHRINPTQKPVDLPAWFIKTYTQPGDVVLDPTCGSGSSMVAAKQLGRQFVGFETDPTQVAHARAWLSDS